LFLLPFVALFVLGAETHGVAQSKSNAKSPPAKKPSVTAEVAELKERVASLEREIELLKTEIKALRRDKKAAAPSTSPPSTKQSATKSDGYRAIVTLANGDEVKVDNFQVKETPSGFWIGETPKRFATDFYYRVEKNGVSVSRAVPFSQIDTIEFTTFVHEVAKVPVVGKIVVRLREGGAIEWDNYAESVTVSSADGKTEKLKSFGLSAALRSGEKIQGQEYSISGFVGSATVDGERGEWEAAPVEIKSIRFTTKK